MDESARLALDPACGAIRQRGDRSLGAAATGRQAAYYLRDLGYWLRERAEEATREARSIYKKRAVPDRTVEDAFVEGRAQAFYEVIDHMHHEAETFGIPLADLAHEDLDPQRDLI